MNVKEQTHSTNPKFVNTESYTWVFGIKGNIPTLYDTLFLAETRNVGFSPYLQIQLCPPLLHNYGDQHIIFKGY